MHFANKKEIQSFMLWCESFHLESCYSFWGEEKLPLLKQKKGEAYIMELWLCCPFSRNYIFSSSHAYYIMGPTVQITYLCFTFPVKWKQFYYFWSSLTRWRFTILVHFRKLLLKIKNSRPFQWACTVHAYCMFIQRCALSV